MVHRHRAKRNLKFRFEGIEGILKTRPEATWMQMKRKATFQRKSAKTRPLVDFMFFHSSSLRITGGRAADDQGLKSPKFPEISDFSIHGFTDDCHLF